MRTGFILDSMEHVAGSKSDGDLVVDSDDGGCRAEDNSSSPSARVNGPSSGEQELHISKVTDFYEKWKDRQELMTNEQEERGEEHNQEEDANKGANGTEEARDEDYEDEQERHFWESEWPSQDKHLFVLSSAGKPIYSRYGDEQKLCGLMGVMQAIFSVADSNGDQVKHLIAGRCQVVFLARGPLYFVIVSTTGEPAPLLRRQLEFVYLQIVSTITSAVNKIFLSRPCFDLRSLLRGSNKFMDNLIVSMDTRPSFLLNAGQCLPLANSIRQVIATILQSIKTEDLVYAMLIADGKVVDYVQPKRHPLAPEDLHLILNFLESSGTFRANETWVPICLPKFNDGGYLYAYLCYLTPETCLLLVSTVRLSEKFYELANWKNKIDKSLRAAGALEAINRSVVRQNYRVAPMGISGLITFLYKSNHYNQFTSPSLEPPYSKDAERMRIFRIYQTLYAKLSETDNSNGSSNTAGSLAHKMFFKATERENVLAWATSEYLLFAIFECYVSKAVLMNACNELLRWIKQRENILFIQPSASHIWS